MAMASCWCQRVSGALGKEEQTGQMGKGTGAGGGDWASKIVDRLLLMDALRTWCLYALGNNRYNVQTCIQVYSTAFKCSL